MTFGSRYELELVQVYAEFKTYTTFVPVLGYYPVPLEVGIPIVRYC